MVSSVTDTQSTNNKLAVGVHNVAVLIRPTVAPSTKHKLALDFNFLR